MRPVAIAAAVLFLCLPAAWGHGQRGLRPVRRLAARRLCPEPAPVNRAQQNQQQRPYQNQQRQYQNQQRPYQTSSGLISKTSRITAGSALRLATPQRAQQPGYPGSPYARPAYPGAARPGYDYPGAAPPGHLGDWLNQHQVFPSRTRSGCCAMTPALTVCPRPPSSASSSSCAR